MTKSLNRVVERFGHFLFFNSMKKNTDQSELIQQILLLPELKALLELQKTLEIRSNSLSQESGITTVDFSRLRTAVIGEAGEKYKFSSLLHVKKIVHVILDAVKEKHADTTFLELELLIAFSEEDEKILLEEEKQKLAVQNENASEVFEREAEVLLFLCKVVQIFADDSKITREQASKLGLILFASEDRGNILRLAQEYKTRHRDASVGNFLQIL